MRRINFIYLFILIATLSCAAFAQPTGMKGAALTITDADGNEIKELYVRVYARGVTHDERNESEIFARYSEDPTRWELRLNPMREYKAKYLITVTAPGFPVLYREVNVNSFYIEAIKLERLDPKKSFTITGTATDEEGRIVPGTVIGANQTEVHPTTIRTFADHNGQYQMQVALGKYMVACGRAGVRGQAQRIENQVGGSVTKVDCHVTPAQRVAGQKSAAENKWDGLIYFDGLAMDRFGEFILEMTVTLTPLDKTADKKDIVIKSSGGRFGERIKPGDYRLRVDAAGYETYVVERYRVPAAINSPYLTLNVVLEAKMPKGKQAGQRHK